MAGAFARCEADGWAFVDAAVVNPTDLFGETSEIALLPLEPAVGQVRQGGASGVGPIAGRPRLESLADELAEASGGWRPDEVAVGVYGPTDGISAHRDNTFYSGFVAVLTVVGLARFSVLADREGTRLLAERNAGPGDLVLLRGPREEAGLERPFHAVGPPVGSERRAVLVLRRNDRGAGRGWA